MGVGIEPVLYEQSKLYDKVVLGYVPKVTLPVTVTNKGYDILLLFCQRSFK